MHHLEHGDDVVSAICGAAANFFSLVKLFVNSCRVPVMATRMLDFQLLFSFSLAYF